MYNGEPKFEKEPNDSHEEKLEDYKEPIIDDQRTIDKSKYKEEDQKELLKVREALELKMTKNNGYRVIRKPRDQWRQENKITTDSPFDKFKTWLESFSQAEKNAKITNEKLQREFKDDRIKYPENGFDYKKGIGVEGMIGGRVGILAKGFGECSGLVFQTPDNVAVVHIFPNIFIDAHEGGELVEDRDVWSHIRFALKEILDDKSKKSYKKTKDNTDLNKEQIAKLQEIIDSGYLKSTMLSGEDRFVPHEIASTLGDFAKFRNLPYIKTDIHYVGNIGGEGGYAIYANPENLYYVGSNGKIMKKGENLPPTMYEYKNKI